MAVARDYLSAMQIGFEAFAQELGVKEDASKLLHSADHFILCIDQRRQRLIGFACAESRDIRIGCIITLLWVAVDARRHGIATQIMLRMMGYGRSKNMSTAKV